MVLSPENMRKQQVQKPDRCTYVMAFHYEHVGDPPVSRECSLSWGLDIDEQPYEKRRLSIGPAPVHLDLGWFALQPQNVGWVVIENKAGPNLQVIMSAEERNELKKMVLWCNGFLIPPGIVWPCYCENVQDVILKSLHGTIPVAVTLYPR